MFQGWQKSLWEIEAYFQTNRIQCYEEVLKLSSQPVYEMPSSLSIVIIGGAYGGTLDRAGKWDGFAAESETLSWKQ